MRNVRVSESENRKSLIRAKRINYKIMTEVQIKLRVATQDDLKVDDENLKVGQPFWYKSLQSGEFSNKAYIVSYDMNLDELKWQLDNGMIWVPVSDIWLKDYLGKNF